MILVNDDTMILLYDTMILLYGSIACTRFLCMHKILLHAQDSLVAILAQAVCLKLFVSKLFVPSVPSSLGAGGRNSSTCQP